MLRCAVGAAVLQAASDTAFCESVASPPSGPRNRLRHPRPAVAATHSIGYASVVVAVMARMVVRGTHAEGAGHAIGHRVGDGRRTRPRAREHLALRLTARRTTVPCQRCYS